MLRGVLGAASWEAQQMSPQFAADLSLLLSATAHPVVQDLLEPTSWSEICVAVLQIPWQQLVFASCADASDRPVQMDLGQEVT